MISLCGNGHSSCLLLFCPILAPSRACINNLPADLVWCLCHVWFFALALLWNYYVLHAILNLFTFCLYASCTLVRNQFICPQKNCNEEKKTATADFDTVNGFDFCFYFIFVFLIRSNKNPNWNSERPNNINFNTFDSFIRSADFAAGADF